MLKNNFKEIKNKIKCNISDIINTELLRASEQFGIFHSTHEGFGVMNEEFDELKDELNFIQIEMIRYGGK